MVGFTCIDNYYRIATQIRRCIHKKSNGYFHFCSLCFETSCDHSVEFDTYDDTLSQLNWWQYVAQWEAIHSAEAIEIADLLVPYWPFAQCPEEVEGVEYTIRAAYDQDLYGVVNNGDRTVVVDEGGQVVSLDIDIDSEGITWGYVRPGGFYPLATFNERWECSYFPDESARGDCIGYWHIPHTSRHYAFSRSLVLTPRRDL